MNNPPIFREIETIQRYISRNEDELRIIITRLKEKNELLEKHMSNASNLAPDQKLGHTGKTKNLCKDIEVCDKSYDSYTRQNVQLSRAIRELNICLRIQAEK